MAGNALTDIAKKLKLGKSSVWYTVQRWEKHGGRITDRKRSGRPRNVDTRLKRKIARVSKIHPFWSSGRIRDFLVREERISTSYIRTILISHGLRARISRRKPLLSAANIVKRKSFSLRLKNYPGSYWKNVIFSDETIMELYPKRRNYVRRPQGMALHPRYTPKTAKFGGKRLMVWGFITKNGERGIFKVDGRINSANYMNILHQYLMPNMYLGEVFQHDNAPAHGSIATWNFMQESGIEVLENWPTQSPDLNIIENVWSLLKVRVMWRSPTAVEELWSCIQEEFGRISAYFQKLYSSIPRRFSDVLRNKGYPTKY